MSTLPQLPRRLPVLLLVIAGLLAATLSAPTAHATPPTWAAWGITVDFPSNQLQVKYTAYVGTNGPPAVVTAWSEEDITTSCTVVGSPLTFDGDYAIFDGLTYIECVVPSWHDKISALAPSLSVAHSGMVTGDPGYAPVWAAADVRLDARTSSNPVVDATDLGMMFSLPTNRQPNGNTLGRTELALSSGSYASSTWTVDTVAGNRALIGEDGAAIVAVDTEFGWLSFLTNPVWKDFFANQVAGSTIGSWIEAPGAPWKRSPIPPYQLKTRSGTVYIGYSPSTGARFFGEIRSIRFDPGAKGV